MEQAKEARLSKYPLTRDRCAAVSGGHLRYVEVRAHGQHRRSKSPVEIPPLCDDCRGGSVTSWVLDDGRSGAWAEKQEHTLKLADVWRDESYRSTGLPKEGPEFPLFHPFDPDVLYFSIHEDKDDSKSASNYIANNTPVLTLFFLHCEGCQVMDATWRSTVRGEGQVKDSCRRTKLGEG
ncbi:hypothetical protein BAE44_0006341 [Dichanthelium oligosanthes]|uniref:DUF1618 domain-containing protein n=1 Tax=Dichanthelium oligosanthes TaxID=888268 RepID=A0A1E5W5R4_9POAL|nr:hypothetical protein BAE44_0006341 [Dichanthelium oligosanthes]